MTDKHTYQLVELEYNRGTKLTQWRALRSDGKTVRLTRSATNRLNSEGRITLPAPNKDTEKS